MKKKGMRKRKTPSNKSDRSRIQSPNIISTATPLPLNWFNYRQALLTPARVRARAVALTSRSSSSSSASIYIYLCSGSGGAHLGIISMPLPFRTCRLAFRDVVCTCAQKRGDKQACSPPFFPSNMIYWWRMNAMCTHFRLQTILNLVSWYFTFFLSLLMSERTTKTKTKTAMIIVVVNAGTAEQQELSTISSGGAQLYVDNNNNSSKTTFIVDQNQQA